MKSIEVVAAIISYNKKILCVQRSAGKYDYISFKYEFPGGKIEANESAKEALQREIKEELHMEIDVKDNFLTVHHQYPDFFLTMDSFLCTCNDPIIKLEVHVDFKWLTPDELSTLNWAAADIPIVKKLMEQAHEF
jgi:8-oxo-dGTP diphosphatase